MSDSAGPRHAFPEDHDGHPQDPDVPVEDAVEESVTDTEAVVEEPDAAGEQTRAMEPIGAPAWSETPTTAVPAVASDTPLDIPQSDTAPPTTVQRGAPSAAATPPAGPLPPALRAEALGVTVHGRRVFADFDAVVDPHTVLVVAAPSGTGRSTLLLTLTGRFAATTGKVEVAGASDPAEIRQRTAVARISTLIRPEPRLTVGEAIAERALIDGVRTAAGAARVEEAAGLLDLPLDRDRLIENLSAERQILLAVALACTRPAELLVLDDLDDRLDIATQARVLDRLGALAADGPAVVVTTTQPLRLPRWATGVTLLPPTEPPALVAATPIGESPKPAAVAAKPHRESSEPAPPAAPADAATTGGQPR